MCGKSPSRKAEAHKNNDGGKDNQVLYRNEE